jgi:hypothetical protein
MKDYLFLTGTKNGKPTTVFKDSLSTNFKISGQQKSENLFFQVDQNGLTNYLHLETNWLDFSD